MNRKKWFFLDASILFILLFFYAGHIHADLSEFSCGSLQNAYGPFDYRNDKDKLGVVEAYHFSTEVASLIKGKSGSLGGDIDYTLRAFPNHPRALMAMVQLGWREKTTKVSGAQYSVECYLHRAIRFRDDDGTSRNRPPGVLPADPLRDIRPFQRLPGSGHGPLRRTTPAR